MAKHHIGTIEHYWSVISKTKHFHWCIALDETCSMQWPSSWFSFLRESMHIRQKRFSLFAPNDLDL